MRAEALGSGSAAGDERWAVFGAIVFAVVSLVLIAAAPLSPASQASAGPGEARSSAMEAAR
jgi:hypothetical protein